MNTATAVRVSNLEFAYPSRALVLRIRNLEIKEQSIVAIVGPSGCGKTTFLHVLCGLRKPNAEAGICFFNLNVQEAVKSGLLSISFQTPVLMPWRTALENASLPLELRGKDAAREQTLSAAKALQSVELADCMAYYPEALSSGMCSRVAVAQAMTSGATVQLMDEVFGTLDEATRVRMNLMLREINSSQMLSTILFVTHSIDEALLLADRILVFGKIAHSSEATIREDIQWDIGPRTRETRYQTEFLTYRKKIENIFFKEMRA